MYTNLYERRQDCVAKKKDDDKKKSLKRQPPASTPEGRENQLISLAFDAAEEMILSGTASSQVITHFLKLGSTKNQLEAEKLRKENILLEAKAEALESSKRIEELYSEAIKAMRGYQGIPNEEKQDE